MLKNKNQFLLLLFALLCLTGCEQFLAAAQGNAAWNYDLIGTTWEYTKTRYPDTGTLTILTYDDQGNLINTQTKELALMEEVIQLEFSKRKNKEGYYTLTRSAFKRIGDIPNDLTDRREGNIEYQFGVDVIFDVFDTTITRNFILEGFPKGLKISETESTVYYVDPKTDKLGQKVYDLFIKEEKESDLKYDALGATPPITTEGNKMIFHPENVQQGKIEIKDYENILPFQGQWIPFGSPFGSYKGNGPRHWYSYSVSEKNGDTFLLIRTPKEIRDCVYRKIK